MPVSLCERTERALCRRSATFQILQTVHNRSRLSWRAALRNILLATMTAESSYIQTQDSTFVSQVEICTSETCSTDRKSARYRFTVSDIYQSKYKTFSRWSFLNVFCGSYLRVIVSFWTLIKWSWAFSVFSDILSIKSLIGCSIINWRMVVLWKLRWPQFETSLPTLTNKTRYS